MTGSDLPGNYTVTIKAMASAKDYDVLQTKSIKLKAAPVPQTIAIDVGEEYYVYRHISFHVNQFPGFRTRSSNSGVLACTNHGSVIGKRAGRVTITVTAKDGSGKKAKVTIKVVK